MAAPPPKVFVKAKNKFTKGDDPVFSVFVFGNDRDVWNHLFQRDLFNRFSVDTKVYTMWGGTYIEKFYRVWADSEDNEDTLVNSCLPYPNVDKGYVWRDLSLTQKLHKKVMKRGKKRGRIDCTSLKSKMITDLCGEAFVAIDVTQKTLVMMLQMCTYEFQFKLNSPLGATEISKINYNAFIQKSDLIGCVRMFDTTIKESAMNPSAPVYQLDYIDDKGSDSDSDSRSD